MSDYTGSAELLDEYGNLIDTVNVNLNSRSGTGIEFGSWGGHIKPVDRIGPVWDNVVRIRLDTGDEGNIIIQKESIRSAETGTIRTATIAGSGPPPF